MPDSIETTVNDFHHNGYVVIRNALSAKECAILIDEIDDAIQEYPVQWSTRWVRSQTHLRGPVFEDLIDKSPVVDVAERLLSYERGEIADEPEEHRRSCHILNVTSTVTRPGDPGHSWHIDDYLLLPRPKDVAWDDRIPFPVFIVSALYYLVDVEEQSGPTEVVPGSHKSGYKPDPNDAHPTYQGRDPEKILVKAGDCLLFHHQIWHHAIPHTGTIPRYVQQVHYGARFIAQRFFPSPNYNLPAPFLERLSPRQQRLLGLHPCLGQYA